MIKLFFCDSFYPSFTADVLIAFLGAFLGLVAAYYIYQLSIRQIRKDRLKYLVALIEKIAPSAIRQAQFCREHAELITNEPFSNQNLKLEANRDPKRLADKVDQEGVYHAYLWKYKRNNESYKAFQTLYGYIDYIDYLVNDLIRTNEKILTFTWERKKQYQLIFKKAKEAIQSLSLIPDLVTTQPELVTYAGKLLEEFANKYSEGENITGSYKIVVEPLHNYIVKTAKQHPAITELLFLIQDLFNEYHGIELAVKHNADDYRYYSTSLAEATNNLMTSSQQLRDDFSSDKITNTKAVKRKALKVS